MTAYARRLADKRGFTLVELVVIIMIIGVLTMIAVPAFLAQRARADDSDAQVTIRTAAIALVTHLVENETFEATLPELVEIDPALGAASRFLAVSGDSDEFTVDERSRSGTTFTYVHAATGIVTRVCSRPGHGLCRENPDARGNRW